MPSQVSRQRCVIPNTYGFQSSGVGIFLAIVGTQASSTTSPTAGLSAAEPVKLFG